MKPTVEQNNLSKRGGWRAKERRDDFHSSIPIITPSRCRAIGAVVCGQILSFRNISGEYFRHEARNEFCVEALAFFAMVVTAAIPILNNMHALADFLRVIGRF